MSLPAKPLFGKFPASVLVKGRAVAGNGFRPAAVEEELRKLRLAEMKRLQTEKINKPAPEKS